MRDVRAKLAEQGRRLAHTSLVTTLNTMVRKKYVERQRQGNAYVFTPRPSPGKKFRPASSPTSSIECLTDRAEPCC